MHFVSAFSLNLAPIVYIIQTIGDIVLRLAPAAIVCSFAASALLWVFAGPSEKMVKMARSQFIATVISTVIIAGYFLFKTIAVHLALGGFGAN